MRRVFPGKRRVRRKRTPDLPGAKHAHQGPPDMQTHRWPPRTAGPSLRANGAIRPAPPPSYNAGADPLGHRCFMEPAITRELRRALGLVRRLVLRDDVGGNTPALIDLVTALLRPCPDLGTALAARTGTRPAAPGRSARFARVLHIVGKLFTELARVAGTQIDLIRGAIESKRDSLGSLAPIEIVDEKHLHLLCHGN